VDLVFKQETGRLDCASCRRGYLGASRTHSHAVAGLVPTGRVTLFERSLDVN
jgi:hypothetical protein